MKILITGGAGFIGSKLAYTLTQHEVIIFDNFTTGSIDNIRHIGFTDVIDGDIRNEDDLKKAMIGVDVVYHLAALTDVRASLKDSKPFLDVNVWGTKNVVDTAIEAGVERIIFTSSAAVYGSGKSLETLDVEPENPYGCSKHIGEKYLLDACRGTKTKGVCMRLFNVTGKNSVCDKFLDAILNDEEINVFGGEQTRDFISFLDVVSALVMIGVVPELSKNIFNVGSGKSISVDKLIDHISDSTGKIPKIVRHPLIEGEVMKSECLSSGLSYYGWKPMF
jgi:nucleoside-diphosphate-sugar epimerase